MVPVRFVSGLSLVSAFLISAPLSLAQTISSNPISWVQLPIDPPKEILSSKATGAKAPTDVLHISVNMPYRDPVGMQAFVDSVSSPKSPSYRHFISPPQVGSRFGQSTANVDKVVAYLTSHGFQIKLVAQNHTAILADATVAQAQAAFNTTIENFTTVTSPSAERFAYTTAPQLPSSMSGYVSYVGGLDNFIQVRTHSSLTPTQLRTLYSVASRYSMGDQGQNRTVAISNYGGYRLGNVTLEYATFGLPSPSGGVGSNIQIVPIDGKNGKTHKINDEADIDIQCVLAQAPLCNLIIYDDATYGDASNDEDPVGLMTKEADDNLADVITESYGWSGTSTFYASCHTQHLAMSAEGITYMCASGDSGVSGLASYPYPDTEPEVLLVGGTTVTTDLVGDRATEVTWSDQYGSSAGGWVVTTDAFNVLPSWQTGFGVPTNIPYRLSPDVAFDADPVTGYEIYISNSLQTGWGGTSCAAPTCAGDLADSEQAIFAGGGLSPDGNGKQRFGRINDLLYSYNTNSVNANIFFDITSGGSNGTLPNGNASNAGPGWDTVTGWGPIVFVGLVNQFLGLQNPTSLTIAPTAVIGGVSATGTVNLNSPATGSGVIVALSSNNGAATVPSSVTVASGSTSANFSIATTAVGATTTATVSASANAVTVTNTLAVNPPALIGLTIAPSIVVAGIGSTGTVTLSGVAPAGGWNVNLSSNSAYVTVPGSVTVQAGSATATFAIVTTQPPATFTCTITATDAVTNKTATITVYADYIMNLTLNPTTVGGGNSSTATVTIYEPAPPAGYVINLSTEYANSVSVPPTVTVPAGATSATFTVTTKQFVNTFYCDIYASDGTSGRQATLKVVGDSLTGLTLNPTTIGGDQTSTGTVTLASAAPPGGWLVILHSEYPASVGVPSSVVVPAGQMSANFSITTAQFSNTFTCDIYAADNTTGKQATLTVVGDSLASLTLNPASVVGGSSSTGTVTLTSEAPSGGWLVNLSTEYPSVDGVPATVMVLPGQNQRQLHHHDFDHRGQLRLRYLFDSDGHSGKNATLMSHESLGKRLTGVRRWVFGPSRTPTSQRQTLGNPPILSAAFCRLEQSPWIRVALMLVKWNRFVCSALVALGLLIVATASAQTWTQMASTPNIGAYNPLLLTDGTVLVQDADNTDWWKLTPDAFGNYATGTWTQLASTASQGYAPLYYASAVMPDGRVFTLGGEYNNGSDPIWSNLGYIYDPVANTWTFLPAPSGWSQIGDMGSVVLPNGQVMVCDPLSSQAALFNPSTNSFTVPYGTGKFDANDEEGLTLLPNGTILTVDTSGNHSEDF